MAIKVAGFLPKPKQDASDDLYRGRFTCPDVQWTGESADVLATFTVTAEQVADAAESQLLWTDQNVQRGIQPHIQPAPPRELSLSQGYPDPAKYIFDCKKADDIAEKLLNGEKLFLSPLIWNLRPGSFKAYYDQDENSLYLYEGKFFLPDSHHRQQAIIKAVRLWRDSPRDYPKFSGSREFKIELYFLTREDEGNYFFDKNQRPKPTSKSKAFDLTTVDDLSLLAKEVVKRSKSLRSNVNRVTDRLTRSNSQVITLSTLREMMKAFVSEDQLDSSELAGFSAIAAQFYDMLSGIRPELGRLSIQERKETREVKIVDSAVMMHGYAALMKRYNDDLVREGTSKAREEWQEKLKSLSESQSYHYGKSWEGDIFEKKNPLWQRIGIVKPGRDGKKLTVMNTGAARLESGRVLLAVVDGRVGNDLRPLAKG